MARIEIWRGVEATLATGRWLGSGAIVAGLRGGLSSCWLAMLPFGPDQYYIGAPVGPCGADDLERLLDSALDALPSGRWRLYHYDYTWSDDVDRAFAAHGFQDFVHRYSMARRLPAAPAAAARLALEPLGCGNEQDFAAAYRECLVGCASPMSREDAVHPEQALRFQMHQPHDEDGRRWWIGRLPDGDAVGIVLLDRYGPSRDDWVVTFIGTGHRFRNCGHGRELLLRGAQSAAEAGAHTLHLAVCKPNSPAVALYLRSGFQVQNSYRVYRRRHPD